MRKKWGVLICCALLMCAMVPAGLAEEPMPDRYDGTPPGYTMSSGYTVWHSALVGDTVYLFGYGGVLRQHKVGTDTIEMVSELEKEGAPESETPYIILSDGETLYGITRDEGRFGPIVDGRVQDLVQLDWADMRIDGKTRYIRSAVITDDALYCLVATPEEIDSLSPDRVYLERFDRTTGAHTRLDYEELVQIAAYRDGKLLVYDYEKGLTVYNPEIGQLEATVLERDGAAGLSGRVITSDASGFAYDAATDTVYYLDRDPQAESIDTQLLRKVTVSGEDDPITLMEDSERYAAQFGGLTEDAYVCRIWDTLRVLPR